MEYDDIHGIIDGFLLGLYLEEKKMRLRSLELEVVTKKNILYRNQLMREIEDLRYQIQCMKFVIDCI